MDKYLIFLGTVLAYPLAYWLGGRQKLKSDGKKIDLENKKADSDVLTAMAEMYSKFLEHYKSNIEELQKEINAMKKSHKEEIIEVKKQNDKLQLQFNDIFLAYSREQEVSQNWEKLHRELKVKYEELKRQHDSLQKDHNNLKEAFNCYQNEKCKFFKNVSNE